MSSKSRLKLRNDLMGYMFVAPMVIGIGVFFIYPAMASLVMSFQSNAAGSSSFTLDNYAWVLNDKNFWKSVYNTFFMCVMSVALGVVFPFILASVINNARWGKHAFRGVFFLPNVVSMVGASILFTYIFYPTEQGLMNSLLSLLNIDPIGWFSSPKYAPFGVVLMGLWHSLGYNTIIFLAGLQSVPRELYEAAEVDGASSIGKWWYITIPYIRPIFVFIIVIGTIVGMKRFTDVWTIGGSAGNPDGALLTIVLYIYRNAFESFQFGIGSAAAFLLFVIIMIISVLNLKVFNREPLN